MKKAKHRHKWEQDFAGCPQCGCGYYLQCECGETRDMNKKPLPIMRRCEPLKDDDYKEKYFIKS